MFEKSQFQWNFLKEIAKKDEIPRVLIFSGPGNKLKKEIALNFIKLLNCQNIKNDEPCQECNICKSIEKLNFPDLIFISPLKNYEIEIDQIRDLKEIINLKPFISKYKFVIIELAHLLNDFSQNALLKVLEETQGNDVIFILLVDNFKKLKETVISRGAVLKFYQDTSLNIKKFDFFEDFFKKDLTERFLIIKEVSSIKDKAKIDSFFENLLKFERLLMLKKIGCNINVKVDESILEKYSLSDFKELIKFSQDIKNQVIFLNLNKRLALETLTLNYIK
jgi:DNA polymerase III delta prime subunit